MYIVKAYTPCQPHYLNSPQLDVRSWKVHICNTDWTAFLSLPAEGPLAHGGPVTLGFTNFLCCSLWSSFSVSPLSLHSTNGSLFSAGWRLVLRLSSGCSEGAAVAVVITWIGKLGVCRAQTAAGAVLRFIGILRSSRLLRGFHLNPPSVFFLVCAFRVLINVTSTMHFCQHTS